MCGRGQGQAMGRTIASWNRAKCMGGDNIRTKSAAIFPGIILAVLNDVIGSKFKHTLCTNDFLDHKHARQEQFWFLNIHINISPAQS